MSSPMEGVRSAASYLQGKEDGKESERTRIVAWLNRQASIEESVPLAYAASCVEKGEHWDG